MPSGSEAAPPTRLAEIGSSKIVRLRSVQKGAGVMPWKSGPALMAVVPEWHYAGIGLIAESRQDRAGIGADSATACAVDQGLMIQALLQGVGQASQLVVFHNERQVAGKTVADRDVLDERWCHPWMQLCADIAQTGFQQILQRCCSAGLGGDWIVHEICGHDTESRKYIVRLVL